MADERKQIFLARNFWGRRKDVGTTPDENIFFAGGRTIREETIDDQIVLTESFERRILEERIAKFGEESRLDGDVIQKEEPARKTDSSLLLFCVFSKGLIPTFYTFVGQGNSMIPNCGICYFPGMLFISEHHGSRRSRHFFNLCRFCSLCQ